MQNRPIAAAGAILSAMAIIGFIDQFVAILAETSSLWTFHLIRTAMICALVGLWLVVTQQRLVVRRWRGVIARSALMSMAMILYFGTLGFLPVAQAAAGLFTAPIWVLVFSVGVFRQRIGPVRMAAVALGFVGILLVLAPDPRTASPLLAIPVVAGAFYALAVIATRAWCAGETALVLSTGIFVALGLWALGGIAVLALIGEPGGYLGRGWVAPSVEVLALCAMQAVGSLLAVVLLTKGYQLAEASVVTVFEYSLLAFSALFGLLLFGQVIGPPGLAGLALIAVAGTMIAFRGRAEAAA